MKKFSFNFSSILPPPPPSCSKSYLKQGRIAKNLFNLRKKEFAFTLPEILISLTIIGIVAAIVIPSLIADFNEKSLTAQRKALYARFSQALPMLEKLNGYGTVSGTTDTAAETFVAEGLSKVLKIVNTCDNANITECGFPTKFSAIDGTTTIELTGDNGIKTLQGLNDKLVSADTWNYPNNVGPSSNHSMANTNAVAIETANGESILVYYNPKCEDDMNEKTIYWPQPKMCANFIYDLNGIKGPNTVGKDIGFITALYATDPVVVSPMPLADDLSAVAQTGAQAACKTKDSNSRVPNKDELSAMAYNRKLISLVDARYWSNTIANAGASGNGYFCGMQSFFCNLDLKSTKYNIRCIKK